MDLGYIILAGGKSIRLGRDKISETVGDKTLLERVVSVLSLFKGDITVVASSDSALKNTFTYPKLRFIEDIFPDKGSSGGIYTGLFTSNAFYNLVVAGDMPFLNPRLLKYMIENIESFDLVAYRKNDWFEPLHAIYSKNCLDPLKQIMQSNSRIIELLKHVKVRYLSEEEIDRFDPHHLSFFNINTEDDLKVAREIARQEQK